MKIKLQYLYLAILSLIIKCCIAAGIGIKINDESGFETENRDKILPGGQPITISYKCQTNENDVVGELNVLMYCDGCNHPNIDPTTKTAKIDHTFPINCNNPSPITIEETLSIQENAESGALIYLSYYISFGELGQATESGDSYYYQVKGDKKLSLNKKGSITTQFSKGFESLTKKKEPWITKIKNYFIFAVPVVVLLALLFIIYQKSFKPKQRLNAKKSVCKYNFEKNPNTLKSLDSQGIRITEQNRGQNLQKRNSLTNLKTLQSKLKSPIPESAVYESSKPISSRRSSISSSCSSDLSFRLDASYLDIKMKDDDSDNEENNNIESDDEEKLVNNENTVSVAIDDNKDNRERGKHRNNERKEKSSRSRGNDRLSPHSQRRSHSKESRNSRKNSTPMNSPPMNSPRKNSTPMNSPPMNSPRKSSTPMNSPPMNSPPLSSPKNNSSQMNSPVVPMRNTSNSPMMTSPNLQNAQPNNWNNMNMNMNMNNQYGNGMNQLNIINQMQNANNQVSIDIHSPRSPSTQNNAVLSSNLQDTIPIDKNAVIHNASKAYVTANAMPQVGNAQMAHVQYLPNAPQTNTNLKTDTAASDSEDDTAEVVPNHPFTNKVFSVAFANIPENDDELELAIGDPIKFIEVYDDDWALALRIGDNEEGMVPLTCVKEYFTVLHNN
ncbi:hypothetical protein BCR36DRAFT_358622 [Piromyces finnis]|uniref:SH3 domain-containing protein n=1 Tax=Piromyces finnis TaxID=1754191 RepID=A0A1Y1V1V3_9FUNG|nr:hypothetical protein BCR36DRAFT_358622 [Piromyces finnis]|eukprot:ORX45184.1 hypothetical protein BCR36DRAFT_358622 [Piromyces finnis]